MNKDKIKNQIKSRRRGRVRSRVFGTAKRPRLSVFRSLNHIYVQLIDDEAGKTLVSAQETEVKDLLKSGKITKIEKAHVLGKLVAQKALAKKIKQIIFDKGVFKYHGRVKALAEGAREGGLKF